MGFSLLEQNVLPQIADGTLQMPFGLEDLPATEMVTEPMFPNVTVGYSTENGVLHGWTRLQMFRRALRPRVLIYGAVLLSASIAFATSVALRSPFKFDVVKDRGTLARVVDDGAIENVYRVQIMNRTEALQTYRVTASGIDGLAVSAPTVSAGPASVASVVVSLRLAHADVTPLPGSSTPVMFEVAVLDSRSRDVSGAPLVQREKSTFFVPR